MSHKKNGPDRFSFFDVDWIQTDRQTKFLYRQIPILSFYKYLFFQDLLERFNSDKPASKVKFDRRRAALDSDED